MDKYLTDTLTLLGCSTKEIRFYMANFTLGAASINEIAKTAKLQRSTAYLVADSLIDKKLVFEDFKEYGKSLTAVEPATLLRMLRAKKRQLGRRELELDDHMDELQALYQAPEIRPRVRTFQGSHGLLAVWRDILGAESELCMWTNQETESKLFTPEFHDEFIRQRIDKGLHARVLTVHNTKGVTLQAEDAANLRETRLLTPGISFSAETYLYDSKVAILDYNHDIIGIIIESSQVHRAQQAMFDAAWQTASRV